MSQCIRLGPKKLAQLERNWTAGSEETGCSVFPLEIGYAEHTQARPNVSKLFVRVYNIAFLMGLFARSNCLPWNGNESNPSAAGRSHV